MPVRNSAYYPVHSIQSQNHLCFTISEYETLVDCLTCGVIMGVKLKGAPGLML